MSLVPDFGSQGRARRLVAALAVAAALSIGGLAFYWDQLPALRLGGVASLSEGAPLENLLRPISLRPGATIICEGDSLTYGVDRLGQGTPAINGAGSGRVATPYPETMAKLLGNGVQALNRGFPGDKAYDGLHRWSGGGDGDVVLLMYGTNDADPRHRGRGVSLPDYIAALSRLVRRHRERGATVIVLAPPPAGILSAERAIAPYRAAARSVALRENALFVDPRHFLGELPAPLQLDGIHLRAEAYQALAGGLAKLFKFKSGE